ncbi:MAG: hypothetical protein HY433_00165 [Candidatus Liptonbacteria bacterium]|nr:hypothetical protein [Candidatus Liptonbacteria bacterium]
MALPEQVVDRLSREPVHTPGWSGQLLMFAATIFFISVGVYLGLMFGYKPYLNSKISGLDAQIQKFTQEIPLSDQEQLISFYSQLSNLGGILQKHVISSALFDWLEKNTSANIYYTRFNFSPGTNQLALTGAAKTTNDFIQQLQAFQNESAVERINVNSLNVSSNGTWQFDFVLFFTRSFFNQSFSSP